MNKSSRVGDFVHWFNRKYLVAGIPFQIQEIIVNDSSEISTPVSFYDVESEKLVSYKDIGKVRSALVLILVFFSERELLDFQIVDSKSDHFQANAYVAVEETLLYLSKIRFSDIVFTIIFI